MSKINSKGRKQFNTVVNMKPAAALSEGSVLLCLLEGKKRRYRRKFSMNNRVECNKGVRAVTHQVGGAVPK